jgi:hypothetical protein
MRKPVRWSLCRCGRRRLSGLPHRPDTRRRRTKRPVRCSLCRCGRRRLSGLPRSLDANFLGTKRPVRWSLGRACRIWRPKREGESAWGWRPKRLGREAQVAQQGAKRRNRSVWPWCSSRPPSRFLLEALAEASGRRPGARTPRRKVQWPRETPSWRSESWGRSLSSMAIRCLQEMHGPSHEFVAANGPGGTVRPSTAYFRGSQQRASLKIRTRSVST